MCLLFIVVSRGTMTMIDGRGCVFRMGMGDSEVCDSSSVPPLVCERHERGGGDNDAGASRLDARSSSVDAGAGPSRETRRETDRRAS